ncbi:signal transduction histidine kinase [Sphingomonas endophytica]|uniref:histidine kinase n=1 Tax=Sphingomonas endophytica TaxID=869719 RepID=A0A7X0MNR6_9SPHN|nr:ATP-binding protein [Sphingomonas endophytica]MBB6504305.1 signal transduction histidine kinase [Sphingomonas endophytica]
MRRWWPRSLFGQLALLHIAIALAAAGTLPVAVGALLHRVARHYQHEVLHQQAQRVADRLSADRGDARRALASVDLLAGGLALAIVDGGRHVLAARGATAPGAVPLVSRPELVRLGRVAVLSRPVDFGRWIVVSQDSTAPEVVTDDIVTTFLKRFVLLLLPFVMLGPLAAAWLTRGIRARMRRAAQTAAAIGPRALDRRLPQGTLPAEIEPLAAATNEALDRLEQAFAAQAAFAADVAHELRTPLATIRLRADAVTDAAARAALLQQVDRAARVIAQLLSLADLERPVQDDGAAVDLGALAEEVVAERAPAVLASGRTIALQVDGAVTIPGQRAAITLALENLIDNAVRHTPAGARITVVAGPGARLCVGDDGAAIAPERLVKMRERFWKGEARSGGSGLGLSIVARIAAAHGGVLTLAPGEDGRGLRTCLELGEQK